MALTEDLFVSYTYKAVVSGQFVIAISLKKGNDVDSLTLGLPNSDGHREDVVVSKMKISMIKSSDERIVPADNGSWITRLVSSERNAMS